MFLGRFSKRTRKAQGKRFVVPMQIAVLLAISFAGNSFGAKDLLLIPSEKSGRSSASQLLDIVLAGKRIVAVGERGHIIFSDDNGMNWKQADVPCSVLLTAVYFPDEQHGWAVGHDGVVMRSDDNGTTWKKQLDGNIINKLILEELKKKLEIIERNYNINTDSTVLEDARYQYESMASMAEFGAWLPLLDVFFFNEHEGIIVGAYGQILHTTNGGESWEPWLDRIENPEMLHLNGIDLVGDVLYLVGEAGMVHRSFDRGVHWEQLDVPYDGSFFGVVGSAGPKPRVIVFGLRGRAYITENNGSDWELIPEIVATDQTTIGGGTVTQDGTILLLTSAGTFIRIAETTPEFAKTTCIGGSGVVKAQNNTFNLVGVKGVKVFDPSIFDK